MDNISIAAIVALVYALLVLVLLARISHYAGRILERLDDEVKRRGPRPPSIADAGPGT